MFPVWRPIGFRTGERCSNATIQTAFRVNIYTYIVYKNQLMRVPHDFLLSSINEHFIGGVILYYELLVMYHILVDAFFGGQVDEAKIFSD